jgi:propanediol dehydratase small subunit
MLVKSDTRPEATELLQGKKLINFDIKEVEIKDENSEDIRAGFEYLQAKVELNATRSGIIEAIIATKYSAGAEIALTNDKDTKQDDYKAYQEFRVLAKELAE